MRLIDADALKENLDGSSIATPPKATAKEVFGLICDLVVEVIDDAPTIEPKNIIACEKVDELDMLERMYTEPSGDLISRADVLGYIDRVTNSGLGRNKSLDYIAKYVDRLPSADRPKGELVRCKDCEYAEHRSQMPNQVYCHRDTLSLSCSVHDDDDYCKWAKMKDGGE